tara:strand:+ start:992 stop:1198 length:207 start_codon:yes stop_codon:yes gene_type:complete
MTRRYSPPADLDLEATVAAAARVEELIAESQELRATIRVLRHQVAAEKREVVRLNHRIQFIGLTGPTE